MSMVYRAETPVTDGIAPTEEFTVQIGATNTNTDTNTALNLSAYAEQIQSDAYLNTSDKSLNNSTSTGKITRGEVIYLLMNHYFKEEMQSVDLSDKELPEFSDAKLETKALKNAISSISSNDDYYNSSKLGLSISEPDTYGVPEEIYKALILANQKGFITEDTEYDNAITKEDAISLIVEVLRAERGIGTFNYTNGITTTATADTDLNSDFIEPSDDEYTDTGEDIRADSADNTETEPETKEVTSAKNGEVTFASDVDSADKEIITRVTNISWLDISLSDVDFDASGVIDKEEASEYASWWTEDDIAEYEKVDQELAAESSSSSSSSSSNNEQTYESYGTPDTTDYDELNSRDPEEKLRNTDMTGQPIGHMY
jgi:hypothetical protein